MPVIGKDIPYVPKEAKKGREIKMVKATIVHPSTILPSREISHEVMDSVKRDGAQQPIIVRPHHTIPNEYEIIDGHNRFYGVFGQPREPNITHFMKGHEPEILVDIRYGLTDSDVFKLAKTLHKRQDRNTYEKAEFYYRWIEAKELGEEKGALTAVAKEIARYSYMFNSKQSLLSQYVKIYRLFQKLEQKHPNRDFNILKSLAINKLYELTKLMDNLPTLIKVVDKLLKNPNMSLDRLKELVKGEHFTERKTPWSVTTYISPYLTSELKSTLYRLNDRIFESQLTNNEIIKRAVISLARNFTENPSKYEVEIEKVPRKGYEFTGLTLKDIED